jgi:hypothetical protein
MADGKKGVALEGQNVVVNTEGNKVEGISPPARDSNRRLTASGYAHFTTPPKY